MHAMVLSQVQRMRLVRGVGGLVVALGLATLLVTLLDQVAGVPNASSGYLLAVIALAVQLGTTEAIVGAVGAFLLANFLFTVPVHTLTVLDPGEWLNLLLLQVVGVVVGQLAGRQRNRAESAELREREARGLFQVSRALATATETNQAAREVVRILKAETGMARVWIGLHGPSPLERVVADTGLGDEPTAPPRHEILRRTEGDEPARWVALHAAARSLRSVPGLDLAAYRVVIQVGDRPLGSIWALRPRSAGSPGREETRLLAAAADQVAQALERDRLRRDATSVEVARQSEALKSALLDSVSHDLRTPIATIRAAAGSLVDRGDDEHAVVAEAIDRQAVHLDRLVTNLLDMTRIEAGELRPQLRPVLLDDAVADTVERLRSSFAGRDVQIDVPQELPPVLVDEVYLDAILSNLLDNALKYSPDDTPVRVSACRPPNGAGLAQGAAAAGLAQAGAAEPKPDDGRPVRLVVEDAGPGVPDEALVRIFEKFYRAAPVAAGLSAGGSRRGSGIGLAIVRGLTEAMGGKVVAARSPLGGLAVSVDLAATAPAGPS
jgi:two-component system sensor histidine kinase KdpD